MNRILRSLFAVVWGAILAVSVAFFAVWLDRANSRHRSLEFSGWGIFFLLGMVFLIAGIWLAYDMARRNQNEAAIFCAVVSTALITLGLIFVPKHIGWLATWHLAAIVLSFTAWATVAFLIAWRDAD